MAGGFGTTGGDDELVSSINVTPLVDVVLVLLVIFLMTAPVIYQSAIKVQLPQAKTGEQAEKSPLDFSITKNGDVFWNHDRIDWETLGRRLSAMGEQNSQKTAIISADRLTPHGDVVRLMDILRQAGLTRFAMNVEASQSPKQ
jgi:biopolymer transport protein ExbD